MGYGVLVAVALTPDSESALDRHLIFKEIFISPSALHFEN